MDSDDNCGSNKTIVIVDIPSDLDQEDLELYLTNRRLGGGDVEDIRLDKFTRTAVVMFADSEGTSTSN